MCVCVCMCLCVWCVSPYVCVHADNSRVENRDNRGRHAVVDAELGLVDELVGRNVERVHEVDHAGLRRGHRSRRLGHRGGRLGRGGRRFGAGSL